MTPRQRMTAVTLALMALTLVFLLYLPGTNGALYYDDYNALNDLAKIENLDDAKRFIVSGTAGPLGRPLALATYLPHAKQWPESGQAILTVNVIIHMTNGLLLGFIAWMILRLRETNLVDAYWIALGAATLWAVMPIIASASLVAIQRMTTLAALFGLLGIAGFVVGYRLRPHRPKFAIFLQFGSLGLGTLLGLYTKENAALTPIFALLVDTLLLSRWKFPNRLQWASRILLFSALVSVLWYLSPLRIDWFATIELRGWSPWQRLQYQAVILWEYLRLALAPLPTAFGPFHDYRQLSDFSNRQTLVSATAWIFVTSAFFWINIRYKNPWPLFALLWFLTGHLLESTVLGLELVFEHRNYLAIFGIAFSLAVAAAHAPGELKRIAPVLFLLLITINAAALLAMTNLWGNPRNAADQWADRHPVSSRAALHAAMIEAGRTEDGIADLNTRYIQGEQKRYAIRILDRTANLCKTCTDVRMQAFLFACIVENEDLVSERFASLMRSLKDNGHVNISVADGFFVFESLVANQACYPMEAEHVLRLAEAVTQQGDRVASGLLARILFVTAKIHYDHGRLPEALETLSRAEKIEPKALPVLQFQVFLLKQLGEHDRALATIERRRDLDRSHAVMTNEELDLLEREVRESALMPSAATDSAPAKPDRSFIQ